MASTLTMYKTKTMKIKFEAGAMKDVGAGRQWNLQLPMSEKMVMLRGWIYRFLVEVGKLKEFC